MITRNLPEGNPAWNRATIENFDLNTSVVVVLDRWQTWKVEAFGYLSLVGRTITQSTWTEIHTAYASGIGLHEIARNMGIPGSTVLAHAKREGWTRQLQSAKALVKREDALAATPVEAAAMSMRQRGERHVERLAGVSERAVDHIETMGGPEILNSVDEIEKLDKMARRTFGLNDVPANGFTLNVLNLGDCVVEVRD